jgi:glycosyltransferase involved in cell wall biosynthesis
MKITFVLPNLFISGGTRTVLECAERLGARGHHISVVHPLVPCEIRARTGFRQRLANIYHAVRLALAGHKLPWFDLHGGLVSLPALNESLFAGAVPGGDLVIATAASTAAFVNALDRRCGRKLYFVQHYEAWEIWDDPAAWQSILAGGDLKRDSMRIAGWVPADPRLKRYKDRIDRTYKLPLLKFTTSTWLKRLIESQFSEPVIGRVDIGNNFEVFSVPEVRPRSERLVLMPFRGFGWKGGGEALSAAELIRRGVPDVRVVMYGPKRYRRAVPDWVDFQPTPSDIELKRLYASALLFVLPSWVEGWSSPPMEAMACGTACVCTDVGAVTDYAVPGETVVIVPPRDAAKLADACVSLLCDDARREKIARAGHDYIQRFTWNRTVDQMEAIFKETVAGRPEGKEDKR